MRNEWIYQFRGSWSVCESSPQKICLSPMVPSILDPRPSIGNQGTFVSPCGMATDGVSWGAGSSPPAKTFTKLTCSTSSVSFHVVVVRDLAEVLGLSSSGSTWALGGVTWHKVMSFPRQPDKPNQSRCSVGDRYHEPVALWLLRVYSPPQQVL